MKEKKHVTTGTGAVSEFEQGYGVGVIRNNLQNAYAKCTRLPEGKQKNSFLEAVSKATSILESWIPELSGGAPLEA